jgi:hypothetical protein
MSQSQLGVGTTASAPVVRQAASVLRLAARVFGDVPAADARPAAAAVRCFASAPTPAHYLAAMRALRHSVRHRRTEEGLDVLARAAELAPELVDALHALPADARNRRRLVLIAEMLTAYRLIEARATGAQRELRRALGPPPRSTTAGERRRQRRAGWARR